MLSAEVNMRKDNVQRHLVRAIAALDSKVSSMDKRLARQEKINHSMSQELANLQVQVRSMRDERILDAIDRGEPYRKIGSRHHLSAARIAQIKKENLS
jgi:DNA-binding NarL/FixJ family response regulator